MLPILRFLANYNWLQDRGGRGIHKNVKAALEHHRDLTIKLFLGLLMAASQLFGRGGPDAWSIVCFRCDHAALLEQLVDQLRHESDANCVVPVLVA